MEIYNGKIPIKNIYYMLCYAYRELRSDSIKSVETESFDNIFQLMAEILTVGVSAQIKKGLFRSYEERTEEIPSVKGRLEISETISRSSLRKCRTVCSYDVYTENTLLNRIIKSTLLLLLSSEIKDSQAERIKKLLLFFGDVDTAELHTVKYDRLVYNGNNSGYRLLMNICRMIAENMLHTTENGNVKLEAFSEENLALLYEKFILNYYDRHFHELKPSSSEIKWAVSGNGYMLPKMQSDIMLTRKNSRLIIDAKFYSRSTQEHYGKDSFHSHNLYQIFTYVKNEAVNYGGNVSGLLLYAKTADSKIPVNGAYYNMGGNMIGIDTLDLGGDFSVIENRLNNIAEKFISETNC